MHKYVLLIFAIIYSISFLFWNRYVTDSCYWFNIVDIYDGNFMEIFTLWIGHIWKECIGQSLLLFKLLGWLLSVVGILIPFCFLLKKNDWRKNLIWLIIGIIFLGNWNNQLYNSDSWTCLAMTILGCLFYKWESFDIKRCLLLSFIVGVAIASRFPNIVITPIIMLYIIVITKERTKRFLYPPFFLLGVCLVNYIVVCSLCGSWNYLFLLKTAWTRATNMPSYDILSLVSQYWWPITKVVNLLLAVIGLFFISWVLGKRSNNRFVHLLITVCVFELLRRQDEFYMEGTFAWQTFVGIIILIVSFYKFAPIKGVPFCVVFFCLGLTCIAGSNTATLKWYPFFVSFLPLLLFLCKDVFEKYKVNKTILLSVVLFSIWFYISPIKQQLPDCQFYSHPKIMNFVNNFDYNMYEDCTEELREIGDFRHIQLVGNDIHRQYVVSGIKVPRWYNFRTIINQYMIDGIMEDMENDKLLKIVDYEKSLMLKDRMVSYGHEVFQETDHFIVYKY